MTAFRNNEYAERGLTVFIRFSDFDILSKRANIYREPTRQTTFSNKNLR